MAIDWKSNWRVKRALCKMIADAVVDHPEWLGGTQENNKEVVAALREENVSVLEDCGRYLFREGRIEVKKDTITGYDRLGLQGEVRSVPGVGPVGTQLFCEMVRYTPEPQQQALPLAPWAGLGDMLIKEGEGRVLLGRALQNERTSLRALVDIAKQAGLKIEMRIVAPGATPERAPE